MKKVEVKYTPHRVCGCDPMALKNTIAVSAEIDGKKYGDFLELEDEETTYAQSLPTVRGQRSVRDLRAEYFETKGTAPEKG